MGPTPTPLATPEGSAKPTRSPRYPFIYEINTWVWLEALTWKHNRRVTLSSVPGEEWAYLSSLGFDAVWLMGVWRRSPAGIAVANRDQALLQSFRKALPDFQLEDNVGSPYCVREYVVDEHLGGREGLTIARNELASRGLALILDFVPNHVAPDHPWVTEHPEYFIHGTADDARNDSTSFVQVGNLVFARGRDPYFPAWPDVLQLNAFQDGLRRTVVETLSDIAGQCDGVRCDMAMLTMSDIFERTWGHRAGRRPDTEYWKNTIAAVKKAHPAFLFIAEAYWDLEWQLQQQGFDFCYDKRLYDRLEHDHAESVRGHLRADLAYQERLVRFIENHDEPRVAATFSPRKARTAAVTFATIPGAKLFHDGQFEGRKIRLPVFLGRRPAEDADADLHAFYDTLLKTATTAVFRDGDWQLCDCSGWPDNRSYENLVAWCWRSPKERCLVVVNLSDSDAQGLVRLPWDDLKGRRWQVGEVFSGEMYERGGEDMSRSGLFVALVPWGFHVLTRWIPR